jgi:hypothetical protein
LRLECAGGKESGTLFPYAPECAKTRGKLGFLKSQAGFCDHRCVPPDRPIPPSNSVDFDAFQADQINPWTSRRGPVRRRRAAQPAASKRACPAHWGMPPRCSLEPTAPIFEGAVDRGVGLHVFIYRGGWCSPSEHAARLRARSRSLTSDGYSVGFNRFQRSCLHVIHGFEAACRSEPAI